MGSISIGVYGIIMVTLLMAELLSMGPRVRLRSHDGHAPLPPLWQAHLFFKSDMGREASCRPRPTLQRSKRYGAA